MLSDPNFYRGRFAPSPTGPLHFGSLLAAVGSFLDARSQGGEWLVRIEDLDAPRTVRGAAAEILRTLDALGMYWDGEIVYQSARDDAYQAAWEDLHARGLIYPCTCSRSEIADSAVAGADGPVYPGTCRQGIAANRKARAWRVRTTGYHIQFTDRVQGSHDRALDRDFGDFIVRRADGPFAYQLAVVVDDAAQGITDVVRGSDLLHSTPRQIHLQTLLGLPHPRYLHLPVAVNERGEKLSKQTGAAAIDTRNSVSILFAAIAALGQNPPAELVAAALPSFWEWALTHWQINRIPAMPSCKAADYLA